LIPYVQDHVILRSASGVKAKVLIAYLSYSGNTKEVAELLAEWMEERDMIVDLHLIGMDPPVDVSQYDRIFIGTCTWESGSTTDEVKDIVYILVSIRRNILNYLLRGWMNEI